MNLKYIIFTMLILASIAAASDSAFGQIVKPNEISEIILRDDGGFCYDCEEITTLRRDGSAIYHGGRNAFRKGDYAGAIGKAKFAALAKKIVEAGFLDLKDRYEGNTNDAATIKITVVYAGGERKSSENYGMSDEPKFKIVERAVNEIALKIKWKKSK